MNLLREIIIGLIEIFKKQRVSVTVPILTFPRPKKYNFPEIDIHRSIPFEYLVWHHSLSPDGITRNTTGLEYYHTHWVDTRTYENVSADKVAELRKQGVKLIPPSPCIKYYFIVEDIDKKERVIEGRSLNMRGGHAVGFNSEPGTIKGLGACAIGNFDIAPPDAQTWDLVVEFTKYAIKILEIPKEKVIGHRDTYTILGKPIEKSCPGKYFDLNKLRSEI